MRVLDEEAAAERIGRWCARRLLAYSGHTSVASLDRYARVSPQALARRQETRDPAARRR